MIYCSSIFLFGPALSEPAPLHKYKLAMRFCCLKPLVPASVDACCTTTEDHRFNLVLTIAVMDRTCVLRHGLGILPCVVHKTKSWAWSQSGISGVLFQSGCSFTECLAQKHRHWRLHKVCYKPPDFTILHQQTAKVLKVFGVVCGLTLAVEVAAKKQY